MQICNVKLGISNPHPLIGTILKLPKFVSINNIYGSPPTVGNTTNCCTTLDLLLP